MMSLHNFANEYAAYPAQARAFFQHLSTITDEQGTVHALGGVTRIAPGSYANVVTLGSYKAVKADDSFAPIHKGDLLVASPHPGYAMKATDLIPLLITLK